MANGQPENKDLNSHPVSLFRKLITLIRKEEASLGPTEKEAFLLSFFFFFLKVVVGDHLNALMLCRVAVLQS